MSRGNLPECILFVLDVIMNVNVSLASAFA